MRAVLYARVSKADGDQDPAVQLNSLRDLSTARGWRVVEEAVDRVSGDPQRRGRNPPGLARAIDLLASRRADVLVVFAADRLVRSPLHLLALVGQVQAAGGRVCSLQDGADLDTTTDQGELLLFLRGWVARMELRLTRARTVAGLQKARAAGVRLGRPRALSPDDAKAQALLDAGAGYRALAAGTGCSEHAARAWIASRRPAGA